MEQPRQPRADRRRVAIRTLGVALGILFLVSSFEVTSFTTQFMPAVSARAALPTNVTSTESTTSMESVSSTTSTILTFSSSSNSITFTEVSTYSGTPVSQSQIDKLLANGTIPGTIIVGATTTSTNWVGNPNFTVGLFAVTGSLTISIGAQDVSGSRVVLLNVSKNSYLNIQGGYIAVFLDNQTVAEAASLDGVLKGGGTPSYILLGTSSGFEFLLSVPHFSTHTIVITTPKPSNKAKSNSGALTLYIVGAIVVITIVLAVVFATRNPRNKKTVPTSR